MRPFSYFGAARESEKRDSLKLVLKTVANILICNKTLCEIENIIQDSD